MEDVHVAVVESMPDGTERAVVQGELGTIGDSAPNSVGFLSYVMVVRNLPRSFLDLRLLLQNIPVSVESTMTAWRHVAPHPPANITIAAPTMRRLLLQDHDAKNDVSHTRVVENHQSSVSKQSRQLQQTPASEVVPVYGIVAATAAAVAICGNGVCEYGEAVGTWAYTDSWHCPEDCPFDLYACPQQVCPH